MDETFRNIARAGSEGHYEHLKREHDDAVRRHNANAAADRHLANHSAGGLIRRDSMPAGPVDCYQKHNEATPPDTGLQQGGDAQGSVYKQYR